MSLTSFLKSASEWNRYSSTASPKSLSFRKKNAVTIEEKIINGKGKSHFPCMKSHSNFWNGMVLPLISPGEPETGMKSLSLQKTNCLPAMKLYFQNQNSKPLGLTVGTEHLKSQLFWTGRTCDSLQMALPSPAIRTLPSSTLEWVTRSCISQNSLENINGKNSFSLVLGMRQWAK